METFQISNGMVLTDTPDVRWEVKPENRDGSGKPFYSVYVSTSFMDGHTVVYFNNTLSIFRSRYSADEPTIRFKVDDINEASKMVLLFVHGMKCFDDFKESVYYSENQLTRQ